MATTTGRRGGVKRQDVEADDEAREMVQDQVEELARAGAREMLMAALNEEVDAYLGRSRYQREEAFRVDWSGFLRQQHDRTRKALAMLAEGHKQVEVADRLGVTPAAVCLWVGKAEREWESFQGEI